MAEYYPYAFAPKPRHGPPTITNPNPDADAGREPDADVLDRNYKLELLRADSQGGITVTARGYGVGIGIGARTLSERHRAKAEILWGLELAGAWILAHQPSVFYLWMY